MISRRDRSVLALSLICLAAIASCSGPSSAPSAAADPAPRVPALAKIDRLIAQETERPVRSTMDAPPPPTIGTGLVTPLPSDDPIAFLTLDEIATRFSHDDSGAPAPIAETRDGFRSPALRAYLQGKQALHREDHEGAIDRFRTATRLAPTSVEPWIALGQTYSAMGNRLSAAGAYKRVLAIDPEHLEALDELAQQASELGRFDEALGYLLRLRALPLAAVDPALPALVDQRTGITLLELGYLRAASQAFDSAASGTRIPPASTLYSRERDELTRLQSGMPIRLGDLSLKLGDPGLALNFYERAHESPGIDGTDVLPRIIYANLRLGRPASATKSMVEAILTERVRVDATSTRLIEYLANEIEDPKLLADALTQSIALVSPTRTETLRPVLQRAAAISLGPEDAERFLLDQLSANPHDRATLQLIVEMQGDRPEESRAKTLRRLIAANPSQADAFIGAASWAWGGLSESHFASPELREPPDQQPDDDIDRLIRGLLLWHNADPTGAITTWAGVESETLLGQMAHAHRAYALIRLEQRDEAAEALRTIDASPFPIVRLRAASHWIELEAFENTDRIVDAVLADKTLTLRVRAEALLTRSDLILARGGEQQEAYEAAAQALELVPAHPPAIGRMLTIAIQMGDEGSDLFDESSQLAIEALPSGHPVAVRARVRRLLGENRQNVALRILESETTASPTDENLETLYRAMLAANNLHERLIDWLEAREPIEPANPRHARWRAAALVGTGESELARDELIAWIEKYPGDDEARLTLAEIERRAFENADRADEMIVELLSRRPPTLDRLLLRLQIAQRQSDIPAMTDALTLIGDDYARLAPPQRAAIYQFVEWARRIAFRRPAQAAEARDFIEQVAQLDPDLPSEIVGILAFLEVRAGDPPRNAFDRLRDRRRDPEALDRAIQQYALSVMSSTTVNSAHYLFLELAATHGRGDRDDRFVSWLSAILVTASRVQGDDVQPAVSVRRAVESLDSIDSIAAIVDGIVARLSESGIPDIAPADIAYSLAVSCDNAGATPERTDELYRLTIRFDPSHANANNNLGYRMLERGDDPLEAYDLIKQAYESDPNSPHILDSYGWALHKIGRHVDTDEGPGAITMLERAEAATRRSMSDLQRAASRSRLNEERIELLREAFFDEATLVTIISHLGDALWAAGEREKAIGRWNHAITLVDSYAIREFEFEIPEALAEQYTIEAERARARVRAASEDRDPLTSSTE